MEYTNNRTTAITVAQDDPRCVVIRESYGSADKMLTTIMGREPSADTPSLVMVLHAYGHGSIIRQLGARVRAAVLRMDDTALNDEEIMSIATAMASDKAARTLGYDLVMEFFSCLERGEYEVFSFKPRHVMAAFRKYERHARQVQSTLKQEAEWKRYEEEMAEHRKHAITFEEYKRRTGYQGENPINQQV